MFGIFFLIFPHFCCRAPVHSPPAGTRSAGPGSGPDHGAEPPQFSVASQGRSDSLPGLNFPEIPKILKISSPIKSPVPFLLEAILDKGAGLVAVATWLFGGIVADEEEKSQSNKEAVIFFFCILRNRFLSRA